MKFKPFTVSLLAAALLASVSAVPAMAQNTNTRGIDQTQQEIRARIQQGINNGQITQQEAQDLFQQERSIQFREMRYKQDGSASPQEREALRRELEAMSADVDRKLANNRGRNGGMHTPGVDNRQERIGARIDAGVDSGRITRAEARKLHQRESDIQKLERRYKSDGRVTPAERRRLQQDLDKLNADLDRMLRNDRHNRR
jgi:hypothetical protein